MIDYNGTKIIAIDHGYGNIKTANTVTPTGITEYESEPVLGGDILEFDGKWFKVGDDHKAFIADKSSDDEFYLLTLMAIAKELDLGMITDADVHIACGLPLKWTGSQKDAFRDYLMRSRKVSFRYNGKEYRIKITGCTVLPQSYPAVAQYVGKYKGTHMVADIGNGTMNIMYIQRYTKEFREEWAFFLNEQGDLAYAEKCTLCERDCKQSFRAAVIYCPKYIYSYSNREEVSQK